MKAYLVWWHYEPRMVAETLLLDDLLVLCDTQTNLDQQFKAMLLAATQNGSSLTHFRMFVP